MVTFLLWWQRLAWPISNRWMSHGCRQMSEPLQCSVGRNSTLLSTSPSDWSFPRIDSGGTPQSRMRIKIYSDICRRRWRQQVRWLSPNHPGRLICWPSWWGGLSSPLAADHFIQLFRFGDAFRAPNFKNQSPLHVSPDDPLCPGLREEFLS